MNHDFLAGDFNKCSCTTRASLPTFLAGFPINLSAAILCLVNAQPIRCRGLSDAGTDSLNDAQYQLSRTMPISNAVVLALLRILDYASTRSQLHRAGLHQHPQNPSHLLPTYFYGRFPNFRVPSTPRRLTTHQHPKLISLHPNHQHANSLPGLL